MTTTTIPDDFDTARDYTITAGAQTLGWMRGDFRQASAPVLISFGEDWQQTGRQVADYRHDSDAAAQKLFSDLVEDPDTIVAG